MKKQFFMALALLASAGISAFAGSLTAGAPVKVAKTATGLMAPVWSPDGKQIAAAGPNYTGIYVFDADGTNARQLTGAEGAGYKMAWSADGKEILGRTNVREGVRVLHETKAWNVATGESRTIEARKRTNANPRTSNTGVTLLSRMTEDAAGVTSSTPALAEYAGRTVINPALSPDGSMIAFQIVAKGMFVINADGTNLRSLGTGSNPAWMPDNNTLVYTIVQDNGNVITGSTVMTVTLSDNKKEVLINDSKLIPLRPAINAAGTAMVFENGADASIYSVTLK
ncbi:MAG: PD40 domain-containing protein [Muribaculaceae bacterium]|nr:PD40 domain-containing protein [Muribaculaceae bacterium]